MSHFQMPVAQYLTESLVSIGRGQPLEEADRLLREHGISALPVMNDQRSIVGVMSRTDLLRAGEFDTNSSLRLPARPVEDVMTQPALTVEATTRLASAAKTMLAERVHRLFVTSGPEIRGVLSTHDLMRAVCDVGLMTPIDEIATKSVVKVKTDDPVALAIDRLERSSRQAVVVVYEKWPVGVFSQADALVARAKDPKTPVQDVMNHRVMALPGSIPLSCAAAQALQLDVRRICLIGDGIEGVVSGLDFARIMN